MRIHPRVFVVIAHKMRNYTIILILIRSLFNATLRGIKCEKTQQILSRETNFASGQLLMVLCPIWQGTSFLTVKAGPCKKIIRRINVGSFYSSVEQECSDDGCVSLFFPIANKLRDHHTCQEIKSNLIIVFFYWFAQLFIKKFVCHIFLLWLSITILIHTWLNTEIQQRNSKNNLNLQEWYDVLFIDHFIRCVNITLMIFCKLWFE